jgi:hypothetical protein
MTKSRHKDTGTDGDTVTGTDAATAAATATAAAADTAAATVSRQAGSFFASSWATLGCRFMRHGPNGWRRGAGSDAGC